METTPRTLTARHRGVARAGWWSPKALARVVDGGAIALFAATAFGYGLVARLSLLFVFEPMHVAGSWPAAGIAVGALLVHAPRRWPAIVLGAATGVAVASVDAGGSAAMTVGFVLAGSLAPLLTAVMLRRAGFASLASLRDVGLFLACGGVVGPAAAAVAVAGAAAMTSDTPVVPAFVTWMLGDAGGVLAVAPLIMLAAGTRALRPPPGRVAEALVLAAALIGLTSVAFLPVPLVIQLAAYPIFLLVVLASLRFGIPGATLATIAIAILATIGTFGGYGPVAHLNGAPAIRIGQLQVFIAVTFLVSFVVAAAMAERRAAETDLDAERAREANRAAMNGRIAAFAQEIARSLDADALFHQINLSAVEVVPADMAVLTVAVAADGPHRIVAAFGAPGAIGRLVAPGDGVIGAVVRDGTPRIVGRVEPDERASTTRDVMPDQPLAIACAPILTDGSVVATLGLARVDLASPFDADEASALEIMAGLAAVAMRNAVEFEKAQDLSIRDELTGLPNRRYFVASFEQLAAQRERLAPAARVPVSAVLFDLDHFGAVNKERGHATGDLVLAEFGRLLGARLRRADVVARHGGEEFVAVLVGTDREQAVRVADEVRGMFERHPMTGADGDPIHCTVSAGVATVAADEPSLHGLVATADVALSMAKRAGRNMVSSA